MTPDNTLPFENSTTGKSSEPIIETKTNGLTQSSRIVKGTADELSALLQAAISKLIPFVSIANQEQQSHRNGSFPSNFETSLIHSRSSDSTTLYSELDQTLNIDDHGGGLDKFVDTLQDLLKFSVNPTAPGFLDKLYAAPLPPGIGAELILAVLNTNVHVYQVSPVLTLIEKYVTKRLAALFGLDGPRAGGIVVTGGSASNLTSIVVARNNLFPETKSQGNFVNGQQLVMFTSAHGHYSIEKAAQALGFGSAAVIVVPTDSTGVMIPTELEKLIIQARSEGKLPFYVNATAGTTVLGSFDPFQEISVVARRHRCWFHIDGAWGGGFIFSKKPEIRAKMAGVHLADSIAINPHKMLGVPVTCSFLLTCDLRLFQEAMTLKAGYLFHESEDDVADEDDLINAETKQSKDTPEGLTNCSKSSLYDLRDEDDPDWTEPDDLADMTLQCGRRGDALKFFMSWQYYGTAGYAEKIETAYDIAVYMNNLVDQNEHLTLVLGPGSKPSCLQVCFYYTPSGKFLYGLENEAGILRHAARSKKEIGRQNTKLTARISKALIPRGFMVDFAPALESQEDKGHFLRVVVNISTIRETVERLVSEVQVVGAAVVDELRGRSEGT